ncbi:hypothetical protein EEB13_22415 [Rhodococcus sp. WS3]|uniref:hypothetical protein n=1 Tax=Rhodococcus sp. WS3 TaxID=2486271 RepID=UPI001141DF7A|nr:hypothetical protein [Rhodococcus sp. WS3]ROZ43847.1 hypothetical protein EEB13_22415 [Rhodococcus sp. WS3]
MSAHGLEQLRKTFPALDAHERGDYSALRQAHPLVDQRNAATNPHAKVILAGGVVETRPARKLSPAAREHSVISAGLDRAKEIAPRVDMIGLRGIDRVYGNTGRRPLPEQPGDVRYTVEELRAEERERRQITAKQQRLLDAGHEQMLDALEYGGQPIGLVVFHFREWTEYDGALACPVAPDSSGRRLVSQVTMMSHHCYWCADRSPTPLDDYLLVDTGLLRVFPTCDKCRSGFDRHSVCRGLDWHTPSDDWTAVVGYPSDEHI